MRLIDADLLMEKLNVFNDREHGNEHFIYGIETAKELLEDTPTAYNVEKVVAEIEKESAWHDGFLKIHTEEAVDIVRNGGLE